MSVLTVASRSALPLVRPAGGTNAIRTGTAPARRWQVALLDGSQHEVEAREVAEFGGRLSFFSGAVHNEVPEVVAAFRSSLVAFWRTLD